jgi:hypothetical protein
MTHMEKVFLRLEPLCNEAWQRMTRSHHEKEEGPQDLEEEEPVQALVSNRIFSRKSKEGGVEAFGLI